MNSLIVKSVNILGVKVTSTPKALLLQILEGRLANGTKTFITTPNPEIILEAQQNIALQDAINASDIALPDGVGLRLASSKLSIIKGREFIKDLLNLANNKSLKVYFLGSTKSVITKSLSISEAKYPNAKFKGHSGPKLDKSANPVSEVDTSLQLDIVKEINNFKPDILLVAFGAPKQELWIAENINKLNVALAMTVGGSLDTYSNSIKEAPGIFSALGLEWLWRLLQEPQRLPRILNAVIVFPLKLILSSH